MSHWLVHKSSDGRDGFFNREIISAILRVDGKFSSLNKKSITSALQAFNNPGVLITSRVAKKQDINQINK